jgi:hypothetical protein
VKYLFLLLFMANIAYADQLEHLCHAYLDSKDQIAEDKTRGPCRRSVNKRICGTRRVCKTVCRVVGAAAGGVSGAIGGEVCNEVCNNVPDCHTRRVCVDYY